MALGKRTKINLFAICALMLSLAVAAAIIIFGFAQYEYDGADASEEQPSAEQEESLASVDDLAKVYDEDGFLTYIQGAFTQRSIKSSDDAIAAVADMAALVGCEDAASEFASVSDDAYSGIAHYRLQQQQDGIPVYGRQLIVSANESDGTATALNSDYAIYEDVDTSPELTQEEAIRMAERSSGSDSALYAELVIYTLNSEGAGSLDNPRLAWCVELSMERYFIDALSGSVLAEDSLINTAEAATGTGKDVSGNERSFTTTSQDDGSFVMIDPDRNLYCYDLEGDDDFLFYESYINESGKQIIVTVISETSLDGKPTYSISRVFADTGEAATIVYAGRGKYTATNADDSRMEEELSLVYTSF